MKLSGLEDFPAQRDSVVRWRLQALAKQVNVTPIRSIASPSRSTARITFWPLMRMPALRPMFTTANPSPSGTKTVARAQLAVQLVNAKEGHGGGLHVAF